VRLLERSVLARSVGGNVAVVANGVASSALGNTARRRAVCAAEPHAQAVGAAASSSHGLRTHPFAPAAELRRERPNKRQALAQGQRRWHTHERPRERGRVQLSAERAAHENEDMSQCLFARSAVARKASASRSGPEYRFVPRALPNPSIERTNNGGRGCAASAAVCAPLFAAHVER
jgi:hypothetical protein